MYLAYPYDPEIGKSKVNKTKSIWIYDREQRCLLRSNPPRLGHTMSATHRHSGQKKSYFATFNTHIGKYFLFDHEQF